MPLDPAAFVDLRNYIKQRVSSARYRVGSTNYTVPLNDVQVRSDGIVRVQFSIIPGGKVTINWVGLYNNAGELWAHQDVNITIDTQQTGVLYWFDFKVEGV